MQILILQIALPTPLRRLFDYLPPKNIDLPPENLLPGIRVRVTFGRQELIGVLMDVKDTSDIAPEKLRHALEVLDKTPLINKSTLKLCTWASQYYQHPIGEVVSAAMPVNMRKGGQLTPEKTLSIWRHTRDGKGLPENALSRSRKQQQAHQLLLANGELTQSSLIEKGISPAVLKALKNKGLIEKSAASTESLSPQDTPPSVQNVTANGVQQVLAEPPQRLSTEQSDALEQVRYHEFRCYLLDGATGSGKTEVYLHAIARTLQTGRQALVLVPEIGLTPQTLSRFKQRFSVSVVELHSSVSDGKRAENWRAAASGEANIIIGTRLSVFTPFKALGIIIVDEEHDLSFKQQDGLRYSARDLAIVQANNLNIPLILGSATPSLESLSNARCGRYSHLTLKKRAGGAVAPTIQCIDMRRERIEHGLSATSLQSIKETVAKGEQALVFINRRGFAPVFLCQDCGWSAQCKHCDTHFTLHSQPRHLRCHHCDVQKPVPTSCPSCTSQRLIACGQGTERTEEALIDELSGTLVMRVDQDSMRNKGAMVALYDEMSRGNPCVLVGTQMLAKGHHFPKVTLVVIVDADQGLLSGDFRGPERMGQIITQVAGRAGRADTPGHVLLQTYRPDHPLLVTLIEQDYKAFAHTLLAERERAKLPPILHMALIKAESKRPENATAFLRLARQLADEISPTTPGCRYLGPIPGFVEKRQSRYRFQLQCIFSQRKILHNLLQQLIPKLEKHALSRRTRWSIDVDPQDLS